LQVAGGEPGTGEGVEMRPGWGAGAATQGGEPLSQRWGGVEAASRQRRGLDAPTSDRQAKARGSAARQPHAAVWAWTSPRTRQEPGYQQRDDAMPVPSAVAVVVVVVEGDHVRRQQAAARHVAVRLFFCRFFQNMHDVAVDAATDPSCHPPHPAQHGPSPHPITIQNEGAHRLSHGQKRRRPG
jgi:hypothetical protein